MGDSSGEGALTNHEHDEICQRFRDLWVASQNHRRPRPTARVFAGTLEERRRPDARLFTALVLEELNCLLAEDQQISLREFWAQYPEISNATFEWDCIRLVIEGSDAASEVVGRMIAEFPQFAPRISAYALEQEYIRFSLTDDSRVIEVREEYTVGGGDRDYTGGGEKRVYERIQKNMGRSVAVKVPQERREAAVLRESQLVSRISHQNIPMPIAVGEDGAWIIEPFIRGENWGSILTWQHVHLDRISKSASPDRQRQYEGFLRKNLILFRDLLRAVDHIHVIQRVVHLDLKPENVMIKNSHSDSTYLKSWFLDHTERGEFPPELFLIDFTTYMPLDEQDQAQLTSSNLRTVAYAAPEQIETDDGIATIRTDIHALGAILHQLLTGFTPYFATIASQRSDTSGSTERRIDEGMIVDSAPPELRRIAEQALQRRPQDRFESVKQLVSALDDFERHETARGRIDEATRRSQAWLSQSLRDLENRQLSQSGEAKRRSIMGFLGLHDVDPPKLSQGLLHGSEIADALNAAAELYHGASFQSQDSSEVEPALSPVFDLLRETREEILKQALLEEEFVVAQIQLESLDRLPNPWNASTGPLNKHIEAGRMAREARVIRHRRNRRVAVVSIPTIALAFVFVASLTFQNTSLGRRNSVLIREQKELSDSLDQGQKLLATTQAQIQEGERQAAALRVQKKELDHELLTTQERLGQSQAEIDASRSATAMAMTLSTSVVLQQGGAVPDFAIRIQQLLSHNGANAARIRGSFAARFVERFNSRKLTTIWRGHTGPILAFWVSPDGRELSSASSDGTIKIWDIAAGTIKKTIPYHDPAAIGIAGIAGDTNAIDGKYYVLGIANHSSAAELSPPVVPGEVIVSVGDSPDRLESIHGLKAADVRSRIGGKPGTEVSLQIRNPDTGIDRVVTLERRPFANLYDAGMLNSFSPNGQWLALSVGMSQLAMVEVASGKIHSYGEKSSDPLTAFAFAPDSNHYAVGRTSAATPLTGTIKLTKVVGRESVRDFNLSGELQGIGFDPRGRQLFASWDPKGGFGSRPIDGGDASIEVFADQGDIRGSGIIVSVSPSGKWIFHGGHSSGRHVVSDVVYNVEHKSAQWFVNSGVDQTIAVAFDPTEQLIAIGDIAGTTRIRRTSNGELLASFRGPDTVRSLVFAPHGESLLIGGIRDIIRWNFREEELQNVLPLVNEPGSITAADADPIQDRLLVARRGLSRLGVSSPTLIEVVRLSSGEVLERWPGPTAIPFSVTINPDESLAIVSRRPVVYGEPAELQWIDIKTGDVQLRPTPCRGIANVARASGGRFYVVDNHQDDFYNQFSGDHSRWPRLKSRAMIGEFVTGKVVEAKTNDRMERILVSESGDVVIGIGDAITLRKPETLELDRELPLGVAQLGQTYLSPNGVWLVSLVAGSGESNRSSIAYDLESNQSFQLLGNLSPHFEAAFSANSQSLLVVDALTNQRLIYQMPGRNRESAADMDGDIADALRPMNCIVQSVRYKSKGLETSPISQTDSRSFFVWSSQQPLLNFSSTGSVRGALLELSAETGKTLREIGYDDGVAVLSKPTHDGTRMISANADGSVRQWRLDPQLPKNEPRFRLLHPKTVEHPFPNEIQALRATPDNKYLALAVKTMMLTDPFGGFEIQVWETATRKLVFRGSSTSGSVEEISFLDPTGTMFAVRGQRQIQTDPTGSGGGLNQSRIGFAEMWDRISQKRLQAIVAPPLHPAASVGLSHQFSALLPQSHQVAFVIQATESLDGSVAQSSPLQIATWDLKTGNRVGLMPKVDSNDAPSRIVRCQYRGEECLAIQLTGSRDPRIQESRKQIRELLKKNQGISQILKLREEISSQLAKSTTLMIQIWNPAKAVPEMPTPVEFPLERNLMDQFDTFVIDEAGSSLAGVTTRGDCIVLDIPLRAQMLSLPATSSGMLTAFAKDGRSLVFVNPNEAVIYPVRDAVDNIPIQPLFR